MRSLKSGSLAGLAMLLLGSCNMLAAATATPGPVSAPAPVQLRPPLAAPAAPPAPAKPAEPVLLADPLNPLALQGVLTQGGFVRGRLPAGVGELTLDGSAVPVAADGSYLLAFDRDAPAAMELRARSASGAALMRALTIAPRGWQIERVNTPMRPAGVGSADFQARRPAELARIGAARRMQTGAAGWRQAFIWPLAGRVSGRFGSQRIYQGQPGSYHSGMDIAAVQGAAYVAPADGVVILATDAPFTLEGKLLMIDHGMGLSSAFLHSSKLLVTEGEEVHRGQVIGLVGMTGRATGPHLHWALKWHAARLDPLLFVPAPR